MTAPYTPRPGVDAMTRDGQRVTGLRDNDNTADELLAAAEREAMLVEATNRARDLLGAAERVYRKLASETETVNILDQEALGAANDEFRTALATLETK